MNPDGSIGTIIPYPNSVVNCVIFNTVSTNLDIFYKGLLWHSAAKSESENLGGNNTFENAERKNNFVFETFGRKKSVIWYQQDSHSIHVDTNNFNSTQVITDDPKNIRSIYYSSDICEIE